MQGDEKRGIELDLEVFFLIIGAVILVGFSGRLINRITKIPESLFLIVFGLLIGPATDLIDGSQLLQFLPIVSVAAMITILVESGISFDITKILKTFSIAVSFTLLVAIITMLVITGVLVFIFSWNPFHAALLGIISSGTTTVTTVSLLKHLDVDEKVKGLIVLETIINDFTLILGTFILVDLIKFSEFDLTNAVIATSFDLTIAILLGFIATFFWRYILESVNVAKELNYASTLGFCFLLYYIAGALGGNPIIAIFAFALLFGNFQKVYEFISKEQGKTKIPEILKSIQHVQTDFAFFMKSFFFFMLGVTFNKAILALISPILIIILIVAILLSRYISATILGLFDKSFSRYKNLITVMIPRGYTAAVLAFVPAQAGIEIPLFTDIVVILVILTTFVAIGGVIIIGREKNRRPVTFL